jgi:hypothetical protein
MAKSGDMALTDASGKPTNDHGEYRGIRQAELAANGNAAPTCLAATFPPLLQNKAAVNSASE